MSFGFVFGFYGPSRLFHSFWASQSLAGAKTENPGEKPPGHPQASHVTQARLEPIAVRWRVI